MKIDRQIVFNKFNGKCAYCGCELIDKWQVDHAISQQYIKYIPDLPDSYINSIENLMPACTPCNHYKRSLCIESYGEYHIGFRNYMLSFHKRLAKLPKKTIRQLTQKRIIYMNIIANKYGITPTQPFSGKFYFEKQ